MGTYLSIAAIQPPFDIGTDAASRQLFSCNFLVRSAGDPSFLLEDMVSILADAGLGIFGLTLFIGGMGLTFPAGDGPFVNLLRTGGAATSITHDALRYPIYTFQLITRGASYPETDARARACHLALDGQYNLTVPSAD